MTFNKYETYSIISNLESDTKNQDIAAAEIVKQLSNFLTEKDVKAWLKSTLRINEDTKYLHLANDFELYFSTTLQYYNITVKHEKIIKSYNYIKDKKECIKQ